MSLHPAVRLCLWLSAVILVSVLPGLYLLAALALSSVAAGTEIRRHWGGLLWRSKWLLAVITVSYYLTMPGEYVVPGYPGTIEGAHAAMTQLLRLSLILLAVAWLLAAKIDRLLAGIYLVAWYLMRPFGAERFAELAAIRLALVLKEAERGGTDWRNLLKTSEIKEVGDIGTTVEIILPGFTRRDWLASIFALTCLVGAIAVGLRQ